jgi:glycosyltransferase involved in cell wall biosynthesis
LGERTDVEALLPAADMSLLVSHQEGFSNALIEAMERGLPAIATSVGGNIDAIADQQTGRLVPVRDPVSLSQAIVQMAFDPKGRTAMGQAARQRAIAEFSESKCIDRYERLYREIYKTADRPVQAVIDGILLPSTPID